MKPGSFLAIVVASVALAGAAFADSPPTAPPGGKALVYILRPSGGLYMLRGSSFDVDKVHVVNLRSGTYTVVPAPPGEHQLRQAWPIDISFGVFKMKAHLNWEAGKSYYYALISRTSETDLVEVDAAAAAPYVAHLKYITPVNIEQLPSEPPATAGEPAPPPPATP